MKEFQGQNLVDLVRIVSVALEMTPHYRFQCFPFHIWPGKTAWIQQHFLHVTSEDTPVPGPKMEDLVSAKKKPFESERRKSMVEASHPLRHSHVVGVLCFEEQLEHSSGSGL